MAAATGARPVASRGITRKSASVRAAQNQDSSSLVKLHSRTMLSIPATNRRDNVDASIRNYFWGAMSNFTSLTLPMGGTLSRLKGNEMSLKIPRIALFDVWLEPTAIAEVEAVDGALIMSSDKCTLDGSSHVQEFRLDEKFSMQLNIRFTCTEPEVSTLEALAAAAAPLIHAEGEISVEKTFVASLAKDYEAWANTPRLRIDRQLAMGRAAKERQLEQAEKKATAKF
eukprot:gene17858-24246_t